MPTNVQMTIPRISQPHGNTNPVFKTRENIFAHQNAEYTTKNRAQETDHNGFIQKLLPDTGFLSPDCLDQSNFLGSFRYRYKHDIHQANCGAQQGNASDGEGTKRDQGKVSQQFFYETVAFIDYKIACIGNIYPPDGSECSFCFPDSQVDLVYIRHFHLDIE